MIEIDRQIIKRCQNRITIQVWSPEAPVVVLGNGNDSDSYCFSDRCKKLKIPIMRRKGGGGAVLLHQQCIVISMGLWVAHYFRNGHYFKLINSAVIEVLAEYNPMFARLEQQGISDIACDNCKIAGTSIFRSRNYLLYQASILYRPRAEEMEQVLKHPQIEPPYRRKRSHTKFLCGLVNIDPQADITEIRQVLQKNLEHTVYKNCEAELISPPLSQTTGLLRRCKTKI